jgi:hypothetical protein
MKTQKIISYLKVTLFSTLLLTILPVLGTAATGDSCNSAETLSLPVLNSNESLSHLWDDGDGDYGRYYYFTFTPTSDGVISITTTGMDYNANAELMDSTCTNSLTSDYSSNYNISMTYNVIAGTQYKLVIFNYYGGYWRRVGWWWRWVDVYDDFTLNIDFTPDNTGSGGGGFVSNCPTGADNTYRDFCLRQKLTIPGNMVTVGNTLLVAPTTQNSTICNTYTNGSYIDNATRTNNNYYLCQYYDDPARPSTSAVVSSGTSTSHIPDPQNSTLAWAGLYWQALTDDIIAQMRTGMSGDEAAAITAELLARIPPEGPPEIRYCTEIITIIVLNLRHSDKQALLCSYIPHILGDPDLATAEGLMLLAGGAFGLVIGEHPDSPEWNRELVAHVKRYYQMVVRMSAEQRQQLAQNLQVILPTLCENVTD